MQLISFEYWLWMSLQITTPSCGFQVFLWHGFLRFYFRYPFSFIVLHHYVTYLIASFVWLVCVLTIVLLLLRTVERAQWPVDLCLLVLNDLQLAWFFRV